MSEPLLEEGKVIFLDGFVCSVPFDRRLPLSFKGLRENLPGCCLQRASGDKADEIMEDFPNWKAEDIEACLATELCRMWMRIGHPSSVRGDRAKGR